MTPWPVKPLAYAITLAVWPAALIYSAARWAADQLKEKHLCRP